MSRRKAHKDPPDTADNAQSPGGGHGVLDRTSSSLYSPDLYTPSFILPRGSAHSARSSQELRIRRLKIGSKIGFLPGTLPDPFFLDFGSHFGGQKWI